MKSTAQIELDYAKAMQQAKALDEVARDLDRLADNEFQGCLTSVAANWKGDNSQKYVRKGNKLKGDINKSAGRLRTVAATVRFIAKTTRDADLAAAAIAGGGFGGR